MFKHRLHPHKPLSASHAQPRKVAINTSPPVRCSAVRASEHGYDLVLSSGFLAFAAHCGFLQAVEESGLPVRGVMGTSSGALIGSMFCAGYTAAEIAEEFSRLAPIDRVALSRKPWRGVLTLKPVARTLETLLPSTFEDLKREFGVGVVGKAGHELVESGSLAEAVVASAAVPVLFTPVKVPGSSHNPYIDGGVQCRIGLDLWRRERRGGRSTDPAIVHLIGRSSPFSGNDDTKGLAEQNATVVCSPKSKSSLWDISGFDRQFEAARRRSLPILMQMAAKNKKAEALTS